MWHRAEGKEGENERVYEHVESYQPPRIHPKLRPTSAEQHSSIITGCSEVEFVQRVSSLFGGWPILTLTPLYKQLTNVPQSAGLDKSHNNTEKSGRAQCEANHRSNINLNHNSNTEVTHYVREELTDLTETCPSIDIQPLANPGLFIAEKRTRETVYKKTKH